MEHNINKFNKIPIKTYKRRPKNLKDGNPSKSNVVEGDGALEGVSARLAGEVEAVPVDTGAISPHALVGARGSCSVASDAFVHVVWDVSTTCHSVVFWPAAYEVFVVQAHVDERKTDSEA